MSRNLTKKKKSTSKYRKFKISPLIPIIASLEVIILVAISTYAWFAVSQEKEANTGLITVDADSGLDIDFKNANYDDEINIWDYVDDNFKFEPVTSLDGRNVFIPTSGTFQNDDTGSIRFREGTVNDINTKYLNIDFMLTNTTNGVMDVYLNNNSRFKVWNGSSQQNSRALRLAFYQNDGNHGNVNSTILTNTNNENAALDKLSNRYTVYFNKPSEWSNVYAYAWKTVSGTTYKIAEWPGSAMTHVAGTVYSYSFSNNTEYNKIIFDDGGSNQTDDLDLYNGRLYQSDGSSAPYTTKTVYFRKPTDWTGVRAHAFKASGESTSFTSYPGDECTYVGADIYSYTFPTTYNGNNMGGIVFNNLANQNDKTVDLAATDGMLYYFTPGGNGTCTGLTYSERTVYFNNIFNWAKPYVMLQDPTGHVAQVSMISLSGNIYMATVPSVYTRVAFEDGENQSVNTKYSQYVNVTDGYIYSPDVSTSTGYTLYPYSYSSHVDGGNYAVISPGVSAGFQRSYTPVIDIAPGTGVYTEVIPAFASSIDNYIKGSGNAMFTLQAGEMIDLSMIIWLEGTDAECVAGTYAEKGIELYLEFSTTNTQRDIDKIENYTYRFYDKTREVWTSDRLTNDAGVSVAPVMQLYDATAKRGYLMHAASTTSYAGKTKIDMWEVSAPSTLITGSDGLNGTNKSHDLFFRRVDPYNEDEVWNYWHPDLVKDGSSTVTEAQSTISGKTYISFTAFADGAPASSTGESAGIPGNTSVLSAATGASTPARSCGGLWGTYECTLLTMIDNTYNSTTGGHWLANDHGVVTVKYTYKYPSGRQQAIEYKGSGPYKGQIYYFVVPKILNTGGTARASGFRFNRFWNFDSDYAMNILERNRTMSYDNNCTNTISGALTSYYGWLGQSNGASTINQGWFGDILYVNLSTSSDDGNQDVMNGARYMLHFWNSGGSTWDEYLYVNNGDFQLNHFNGYLAIVPKGATSMNMQRYKSDFSTHWNDSANITINSNYHNLLATKWSGDTIVHVYNNNQVGYGWSEVPSYYYPD